MSAKPAPVFTWLPRLHIAGRLWLVLGVFLLYAVAIAIGLELFKVPSWSVGVEWTVGNSLVVGVLLVFRNKEAYDRWWEGRKLWGQLINEMRNLAIKVRDYAGLNDAERREFSRLLKLFAEVLRRHLRGEPVESINASAFAGTANPPHPPSQVAELIHGRLAEWHRDGRVDTASLLIIDTHARELMNICGACERIRNTPVPSSYRALVRHGIGLYLLSAPWLLELELGFWGIAPLAVALYFMIGVELTAEEVEEPFGHGADDLPLELYCETIAVSVGQLLD